MRDYDFSDVLRYGCAAAVVAVLLALVAGVLIGRL
jgi:hypothetical protein